MPGVGDGIPLQLPAVEVRLQPVVALATGEVVAAEALSYLASGVPVLDVLADAEARGLLPRVEAHLLTSALAARLRVPEGALLGINLTAGALLGCASVAVLDALPTLEGLVLELRQDGPWTSDPDLIAAIGRMRDRGALLALDDAAYGFQGLLAMAHLRPDWVKVDRSIVTGASDDAVLRASLEMFAQAADRSGSVLVAEGVESEDDARVLRDLGVLFAQGYLFSPPVPGMVPERIAVLTS